MKTIGGDTDFIVLAAEPGFRSLCKQYGIYQAIMWSRTQRVLT